MRPCAPRARRLALGMLIGLGLIASTSLKAADDPQPSGSRAIAPATPALPPNIGSAMQEGRFLEAAASLEALARQATEPSHREYFGLVRGVALRLGGKLDDSRLALVSAIEANPQGPWATKLRAELAVVQLASGRPKEAEALARAEVERLLSNDRKDRLAETLRAFAGRQLTSEIPFAVTNPEAAHGLLLQARALARGEPLRARLLFEAAQAGRAAGQPLRSIIEFEEFLAEAPNSPDRDSARFYLGEAKRLVGQTVDARLVWSDLARDPTTKANFRARAFYMIARTYGQPLDPKPTMRGGGFQSIQAIAPIPALSTSGDPLMSEVEAMPPPRDDNDLGLQVAVLRRLIASEPANPLALKASFEIGTLYQARGKTEEALKAFQGFLQGEGFRVESDEARRVLAERTSTAVYQVGVVLKAQNRFAEAIAAWTEYLAKFPNGSDSAQARRSILDARLATADDLLKRRQFNEARVLWREFVAANPLNDQVAEVSLQIADSFRTEGKADEAIAAYESVIARYPTADPGSQARYRLGTLFEEEKLDPTRAIEQYQKIEEGRWMVQARQRIAVLSRPSLRVVTARTFRTDEPAQLRITSRNLPRLSFAAYKLDPESFFRKKLALKGVEALDIGLVAPDAEWTEPVPSYARSKLIEATYDLKKLEGPGFWAVKVTDDSALQATTMVLRGDIEAIVKASREQTLVFVQDKKTGKGRKGARVLLSDGKETLIEAVTDDHGIVLRDWPGPRDSKSALSYLVLDGLEAVGSGLSLPDRVSQGLSTRVYLYTDRPAYRPGQLVEFRGVVRDVVDGAYAFTAAEQGKVEVSDPQGRVISSRLVNLSAFGTFQGSARLNESAATGPYLIRLSRVGKEPAVGNFQVQTYELEKADLKVELPRSVVFRGELVQATIVGRSQYGSPLVDRAVEVKLPDGRTLRGTTDAFGKFAVEFATEGFAEEQAIVITARLPQDNVSSSASVILAVRAFRVDLKTDRSVYLDGETFRLRALTLDALGEPTAQTLNVAILKRVSLDGLVVGEREVSSLKLATDPKTGRGEVSLKVDDQDGGSYLLRASGTDRFGNAIFEDHPVSISGRKDATKLRLLTDRTTFSVGEAAKVNLHNRGAMGLTLVTWEADRVLRYRLVEVKAGDNAIVWEVDGPQFPNFTLSASRMEEMRLDEARLDLNITRDLRVSLKAARPTVGPGDEVVLEVTTLDQLDRPVAAELSLALVDKALLRLHADAAPPIGPFFYDRVRTNTFTTGATNSFQSIATTRSPGAVRRASPVVAGQMLPNDPIHNPTRFAPPVASTGRPKPKDQPVLAGDLQTGAQNPASLAILAKLEEPLSMTFQADTPLEDIKKYIETSTQDAAAGLPSGIPIYVDPQGLQDVDKTMASTVSISLEGVPLKTTLRLLLKQLELTYEVGEGLLTITSFQSMDKSDPEENSANGSPAGGFGGGFQGGMGGMGGGGMGGMGGGGMFVQKGVADLPSATPMEQPPAQAQEAPKTPQAAPPSGEPAQAPVPARQQFIETAFWNPSVVTGADGKARVTFKAPSALSEYVFMARGITGLDTLAGQSTADLAVRKTLFVDFRKPAVLLQGDRPQFSAKVHHLGIKGRVEVKLAIYAGDRQQVDPRTLVVNADGVDEVRFDPFEVPDGDVVRLVISARSADQSDEVVLEVPIRPWGLQEFATASGRSSDDTSAYLTLPAGRVHESPDMQIVIGPTTERLILDAAFGPGQSSGLMAAPLAGSRRRLPIDPMDTTSDRASDLLAATSALEYLKATGSGETADRVRLNDRARGLVNALLSTQKERDLGWSWVSGQGPGNLSDPQASASAVWALSSAERLGLLTDSNALDKATVYLLKKLAQADASETEVRASLLHALAHRGKASFEAVNALHRVRDDLSDTALAHLALTFTRTDRPALANEVLTLLATRARTEAAEAGKKPGRWWAGGGRGVASRTSAVEATSLATLAFAQGRPLANELEGAVDWLLAHRSGTAWRPNRANGFAVAALGNYYGRGKSAGDRYRLVVVVNGREVDRFEVAGQAVGRTIAVPRAALKADGKNQVSFDIEGRGTFAYSVTMTGFTRTFDPVAEANRPPFAISRTYLAAKPEFDGRTLETGFSTVIDSTSFENPASQVPIGGRVRVFLGTSGLGLSSQNGRGGSYLILEEPLPAGSSLVEGSVQSQAAFTRQEAGVLTFYFEPGLATGGIRYELYGVVAGRYRTLPPRLMDADDSSQTALGSSGELVVLSPGQPLTDPYRPTPDELYARGQILFQKGRLAEAAGLLESLASGYTLRDDIRKEVVRMLLYAHLATYQPRKIVEDFETIREKSPDLLITFDKLLVIGRAYADIGEHERAYLGWRALAEASYLEDARVAEAFRQQGKPLEAAAYLIDLWRESPDEASIESDFFGLSRLLASLAGKSDTDPEILDDMALAKVSKADLIAQAASLVRAFLARSPRNPLADEASLALLGDELERRDYAAVVTLAERFATLYGESKFRDRFLYSEALGRFHLGQHDKAIALAKIIAGRDESTETDTTSNRWQAIFLLGQIEEARGRPAEALTHYRQVADRYTDAAEAVESLTRRVLKLPEVSVVRPANIAPKVPAPEKPKPDVALISRNVAEVEVQVFPIDLMRFYLSRRGLDAVSSIDLAGVRPLTQKTIKLDDRADFEDKVQALDLPLQNEGAYLVIARGGNLFASGIVLVSSLEMDVTEQVAGGLLRVTVRDASTGARRPDVQIKVIGSGNDVFVGGQTDLRGVFLAQGLRGQAAVVAREGLSRYALYRGTTGLGPVNGAKTPVAAPVTPGDMAGSLEDDLREQNQANQKRQLDRFEKRRGGMGGAGGGMGGMMGGGFR